jgi:hypothetical protein
MDWWRKFYKHREHCKKLNSYHYGIIKTLIENTQDHINKGEGKSLLSLFIKQNYIANQFVQEEK